MLFIITNPPIGIQSSRSGLEILNGLEVEAEKVGDKMVVKKSEIVEKLKAKHTELTDLWAVRWNEVKTEIFNFALNKS